MSTPGQPGWGPPALAVLALSVVVFTGVRDAGLYPHVFADEYTYAFSALHHSLETSPLPSYLYLWLFSWTNTCGEGFLACARLLNAVLFAAALPFIWLVSRKVASPMASLAVVVLAAISPINTYTSYFMPEATYFFGFWVVMWLVVTRLGSFGGAVQVGLALGLLALVKAHGLFLLGGVALFVTVGPQAAGAGERWRRVATTLAALGVGFAVSRLGVGLALGGRAALGLVGSSYSSLAQGGPGHPMYDLTMRVLRGHLLALAVLCGPGLLAVLPLPEPASERGRERLKLQVLTLCVLLPLVAVAALYTARVAWTSPSETAGRIHMRYYDFALPLLMIGVAAQASAAAGWWLSAWGRAAGVALAGVIVFGLVRGFTAVAPGLADCPSLEGLMNAGVGFYVLCGLSLLAVLLWSAQPVTGARFALWVVFPAIALTTAWWATAELRVTRQPLPADRAATVARTHLGSLTRRLAVVATEPPDLYRVAFELNDPTVQLVQLGAGAPFGPERVLSDRDWLLVLGRHEVLPAHRVELQAPGYRLVHLEPGTPAP